MLGERKRGGGGGEGGGYFFSDRARERKSKAAGMAPGKRGISSLQDTRKVSGFRGLKLGRWVSVARPYLVRGRVLNNLRERGKLKRGGCLLLSSGAR